MTGSDLRSGACWGTGWSSAKATAAAAPIWR